MTPAAWTTIIVLGGVGVVLLCCVPVTLVGGYLLLREAPGGMLGNRVTQENFEKVQFGMTQPEVEAILGRGLPRADRPSEFEWRSARITIQIGFDRTGRVNKRSMVTRNP
jgi:hypothetical protein